MMGKEKGLGGERSRNNVLYSSEGYERLVLNTERYDGAKSVCTDVNLFIGSYFNYLVSTSLVLLVLRQLGQ